MLDSPVVVVVVVVDVDVVVVDGFVVDVVGSLAIVVLVGPVSVATPVLTPVASLALTTAVPPLPVELAGSVVFVSAPGLKHDADRVRTSAEATL